jgi:glyoxylase-like metal-dependent hydrolase (beta-lactamase superfamily II)/rhodanese-related sulfurtransferase
VIARTKAVFKPFIFARQNSNFMKVEQLYTGCLAEAAYYIESAGEAAIIDPLRESEPYMRKLALNEVRLKYVFETHFHADFVSGHLDLARKTGAAIIFGPGAQTDFEKYNAADGEILPLGEVFIKVLHTPGHTPESTCYLLLDNDRTPVALFSGDTLFIGDVGRPDLAVKSDLTIEDLAGMLYDSLRIKIMPLPDEVMVYPAHGAGSACGKNMSKETFDTLGNQKRVNYALRQDLTREAFIEEVTDSILPPPQYFPKNAALNRKGYQLFDEILNNGYKPLDALQFAQLAKNNEALVLDTRSAAEFVEAHIPGSLFIGLDGQFAPWVGALIKDLNQAIIFIAPEGREQEVIMRLARVGYDHTLGYLAGGIKSWIDAGMQVQAIPEISPLEFKDLLLNQSIRVLDVRKPGEYEASHLPDAALMPLDFIHDRKKEILPDATYYVHCAGGYRSVIFNSLLKREGFENLVNVSGGFNAIKDAGIPTTEFICSSIKTN